MRSHLRCDQTRLRQVKTLADRCPLSPAAGSDASLPSRSPCAIASLLHHFPGRKKDTARPKADIRSPHDSEQAVHFCLRNDHLHKNISST